MDAKHPYDIRLSEETSKLFNKKYPEGRKTKGDAYHATLGMGSIWLSEEEHRADALALRADERRDKLRKAAGSGKYTLIRRYLNGETHAGKPCVSISESIGYGGEPGELKHLSSRRKRKKHRVPK